VHGLCNDDYVNYEPKKTKKEVVVSYLTNMFPQILLELSKGKGKVVPVL
jgi:hypothetical protein